jgi:hypothetical protein
MDARLLEYAVANFGIPALIVLLTGSVLFKLSADFAKLRTDLQTQSTRDLLNKRFAAYGELWAKQRPLAIYSTAPLSSRSAGELAECLSEWYFSANGGMFLTTRARNFYFALQDLLEAAARLTRWQCDRRPADPEEIFRDFVRGLLAEDKEIPLKIRDLEAPERMDSRAWRKLCKAIGKRFQSLDRAEDSESADLIFAALQQASSFLRTNLVDELHSRLQTRVPKP